MQLDELLALISVKFPEAKREEGTSALIFPKELLLEAARYLKSDPFAFDNLHCITAVDKKDKIEVIYTLYSILEHHSITLKVSLTYDDLNVPSLTGLWKSANWLERETYDFFGVIFTGHPDLRRILNPYDWKEYPLRKSYSSPDFITKPRL